MKERPILFSAPMVRAILEGRKTQTRRSVANVDPDGTVWKSRHRTVGVRSLTDGPLDILAWCPYGQPGDRLWVRETWAQGWTYGGGRPCTFYRATGDGLQGGPDYPRSHDPQLGASPPAGMKWRPSIFMPRWASRILLEITNVRVERLQDISEADAIAEGIYSKVSGSIATLSTDQREHILLGLPGEHRTVYRELWESINGAGSWEANPFVWVIEFKRVTP